MRNIKRGERLCCVLTLNLFILYGQVTKRKITSLEGFNIEDCNMFKIRNIHETVLPGDSNTFNIFNLWLIRWLQRPSMPRVFKEIRRCKICFKKMENMRTNRPFSLRTSRMIFLRHGLWTKILNICWRCLKCNTWGQCRYSFGQWGVTRLFLSVFEAGEAVGICKKTTNVFLGVRLESKLPENSGV